MRGPVPARTAGPAAADRSPSAIRPDRTLRSWPLLVLAALAAAEVWSGWVGIAQKTGFGLVSPLPGICPSLHLDTAITLPVGVEAYAAYALRAWLTRDPMISDRTRRFAKWSAICSFALGMAGQVASHLMAQAGMARAAGPDHRLSCGPCPGPCRSRPERSTESRMPGQTGPRAGTTLIPDRDHNTTAGSPDPGRGPRTDRRNRPGWSPAGWPQRAGHCKPAPR